MQPTTADATRDGAWYGANLSKRDFVKTLPSKVLTRLLADVRRTSTTATDDLTQADFADPELAAFMSEVADELKNGRGVVLIDGPSRADLSDDELERVFWAFGLFVGRAQYQSALRDKIGHVRAEQDNLHARGYRTDSELTLHCDTSDMSGLMCLQKSQLGGSSQFASSITIHDEIARIRPDCLPALYQGFPYFLGEGVVGESQITPFNVPVFAEREGKISCRYLTTLMHRAADQTPGGVPASLLDALDIFDLVATSPKVVIEFDLEPGETAFFNNYSALHARKRFRDDPDPAKKRHLLRLWLRTPGIRPIPPEMDLRPGAGLGVKDPEPVFI